MDYTIFAQSIAQIRVYETRMINRAKIEALVEAKDFSECIRLLQDGQYSKYVAMPSYEEGLKLALEDLYREMYKMIPVKAVVDVLAARYDGHNIKSLIKGKLAGVDTNGILINAGTITVDSLRYAIKEGNYKEIPEILVDYIVRAFDEYRNTQDPKDIDITIDKGMYKYALDIAKNSKMDYLEEIVRRLIDITNIKTFVRIRAQEKGIEFLERALIDGGYVKRDVFISYVNDSLEKFAGKVVYTDYSKWANEGLEEYIRNGDLGKLERYADNFLISTLKEVKLVSFGPEPIVGYILAKENEIKILRIILTGKKNNVNPDTIRERLRDVYV